MKATNVPEGFRRHERTSPMTAPWEPIYARPGDDGTLVLGLWVDHPHTNARGFAHGGLLASLADNAMGLSCAGAHDAISGLITVNLNVDYLGTARVGQWLEFRTEFRRTGRTLDAAQCFITADDTVCARANATYRVLHGTG